MGINMFYTNYRTYLYYVFFFLVLLLITQFVLHPITLVYVHNVCRKSRDKIMIFSFYSVQTVNYTGVG